MVAKNIMDLKRKMTKTIYSISEKGKDIFTEEKLKIYHNSHLSKHIQKKLKEIIIEVTKEKSKKSKKSKNKMKTFEITTKTKYGRYIFLTMAKNGKEALNGLIKHSGDFNNILSKQDSDNMDIKISKIK